MDVGDARLAVAAFYATILIWVAIRVYLHNHWGKVQDREAGIDKR
jgi:hypothetical protein